MKKKTLQLHAPTLYFQAPGGPVQLTLECGASTISLPR
jgi:hypothetical protein